MISIQIRSVDFSSKQMVGYIYCPDTDCKAQVLIYTLDRTPDFCPYCQRDLRLHGGLARRNKHAMLRHYNIGDVGG